MGKFKYRAQKTVREVLELLLNMTDGNLLSVDLDDITPEIVDKLVELGWEFRKEYD